MESNYLEEICFDLQLDQQMLDDFDEMYVHSSGASLQSLSDNFNNNFNSSNKSMDASNRAEPRSEANFYETDSDMHLVPKFEPSAGAGAAVGRQRCLSDIEKSKLKLSAKIDAYCLKIIRDMNTIGVCLIDGFMEELGELVLQEVVYLYQTVVFSDGKVVNHNSVCDMNNEKVRGDSIYWVNGSEPNCKFISVLMTTLDRIIFKCNRMKNNGLMGINTISSRTSAMVACYPGQESRYKQHADNTIGDGRYITCIYYINKNWNPVRDGGLLRIYPSQVANQQPLNIAPEFDRLVCFWSDRRNLHEVLPTKRLRFAITVWYFDEEERKRFRERKRYEVCH